jgi:hypothetical protein
MFKRTWGNYRVIILAAFGLLTATDYFYFTGGRNG